MHEITKEALKSLGESFATSSAAIGRSDRFLTALDDNLPESGSSGSGSYHTLNTFYGDLNLYLYQAEEVAEIRPYMRAARLAGFERVSKSEDSAQRSLTWNYEVKDGEDIIKLNLKLYLKQGEQAACRYVETGKKEVPVMELLCGDKLKEWEETQA